GPETSRKGSSLSTAYLVSSLMETPKMLGYSSKNASVQVKYTLWMCCWQCSSDGNWMEKRFHHRYAGMIRNHAVMEWQGVARRGGTALAVARLVNPRLLPHPSLPKSSTSAVILSVPPAAL